MGKGVLSDTQVFFVAGLVASCGQKMPCGWGVWTVRRRALKPSQTQSVYLRNPQGFTARQVPVKICGLQSPSRHSLTVAARPISSAVETGGLVCAVVNGRQTGNTRVIPGRPRRCIRAIPRCRHVLREEMRPPRGHRPAGYYTDLHLLERAVLPACPVQLPLRGALNHVAKPFAHLLVVVVFEKRIE